MRRIAIAIFLILLFGAIRTPFEMSLQSAQSEAHFRKTELSLDLRERIGQMSFLAALSGFRSLVAAVLWIEAHVAWERTEWGRMAGLFDTVTSLQPRSLLYWDMAAWHMAWNASVAALNDEKQPSEIMRQRAQRQYFDLGRNFLERGIRNNPDRPLLYERLGVMLRDKFEDHCAAAQAFKQASEFPDAPPYVKRFAAYELAKCPGKERQAYEDLLALYKLGPDERKPTLISLIKEFEKTLNIPQNEWIPEPDEPEIPKS